MRYIASFVFVIGLFISLPQVTNASFTTTDFITTWDTENTGTSASNQITIPGTGSGYSYSIYWESLSSSTATGTIATSTSASQTITFPEAGQYKVGIKGTYPRIYFNNGGDKAKILTVEQWGNIAWSSMNVAFRGCTNLAIPATDSPDLSGVTSMFGMFYGATSFNSPINHWDVSHVNDMAKIFYIATSFNQPLNSWDVSDVTSMSHAFYSATSFNQPLNSWDVSSVVDISLMFRNSTSFNQPLNSWDTSKVTDMTSIFLNATSFNQDISTWSTSKVVGFSHAFYNAATFDQNLSTWNIASTTDMTNMFHSTALSPQNQDATLQAWASQSLKSNVPFHLGLKTYSSTGATALDTLRNTYNWTITEQYQANYEAGDDATLSGTTTQSPINLNGTTTAVEVIPDNRCTFIDWSDGNTTNPRTDTLTDNLTVSANVECHNPTSGNSASSRYQKLLEFGNTTEAEAIKDKYLTTATPTITDVIKNLNILATNPAITNDPESKAKLITLLQTLVMMLEKMRG